MGKFKLAIGLHNHQPVGNFESVFEETHRQAYLPFIRLLGQFENIRLSLHQSGILWDWQEKHHPEYLSLVKNLVNRGQVELMTGGFYEPILPSIPDRDKLGQIALLNDYLKAKFGVSTSGLWLTERVWEPHLPKVLNRAGVKYLPIDDTHFLYAGLELDELKGVFVTEEEGATVRLLPIQKKLRYLIPFGTVPKIIEELKKQAEKNPEGMAIYADDGEKFGGWPKTYKHCYEDGWLEQFFEALSSQADWLEVCPLVRVAETEPVGRVYLPTASYSEMLHWSLPPKSFAEYEQFETWLKEMGKLEQYGRYVRGGHWRGFLAKYDEANLMHKRMLSVSERLENFAKAHPDEKDLIARVRRHLYAGQCNCPYWHGVFGGLYLPHLRQAIFENLIIAEKLLVTHNSRQIGCTDCDYDCDGHNEALITTRKFHAIFKPSTGGMLVELDSYDKNFNLTDTLKRRREGYHWKLSRAKLDGAESSSDETASIHDLILTKETGLEKLLADDWYLRRCFIDHFLTGDVDIDKFATGKFGEEGDFVLGAYLTEKKPDENTILLKRKGHLWRPDGIRPLTVQKRFYFGPDSEVISISYVVATDEPEIHNIRLAVENNFSFQAGHADDRYLIFDGVRPDGNFLDSVTTRKHCNTVIMRDDWRQLAIAAAIDRPSDIWQTPIFTISLSEGGFEKVYQGTSLVHIFNFDLKRGKPFEVTFLLFAGDIKNMPNRFLNVRSSVSV